jgi:cystathionine beta-lyase/cystathionine gamma-synthase
MKRIPVAGPWITQKEIDYVTDAVTNAWYENANVYHQRFEKAFAEYIGVRFAVSLPSCTSAIHLSLMALGVGPGDEVIVPEATWIASAAPISYVGGDANLRGHRSSDVVYFSGVFREMHFSSHESGHPRGPLWRRAGLGCCSGDCE